MEWGRSSLAVGSPVSEPENLYRPPAPTPIGAVPALLRSIFTLDRDLLKLMPDTAYHTKVERFGLSRRGIVLIADPALVRQVMVDEVDAFPKNDLMVNALAPLINDGLFVSSHEVWRRQRKLVEPAFSHIRVQTAFEKMQHAVDTCEDRLTANVRRGEPFNLDRMLAQLTADIVFRTIFSKSLEDDKAAQFFDAWATFQRSVSEIRLSQLILRRAWDTPPQSTAVATSAAVIRQHIDQMVAERTSGTATGFNDICEDILTAEDPDSGDRFGLEEAADQIAVFFIAGHETTASVLTWCFFILSQQPDHVAELRREIEDLKQDGAVTFETVKRLSKTRNAFLEALRLYPPLGFIPRVSLNDTELGGLRIQRGTMVIVSPYILHRHHALWRNPDRFDPSRFERDTENRFTSGAFIPFGLGPRVCVGSSFAMMEATLILARLIDRFEFTSVAPDRVQPVCQLSIRPAEDIQMAASIRTKDLVGTP